MNFNPCDPWLFRLRGCKKFRKIEGKTKLASHLFFLDQFRVVSHRVFERSEELLANRVLEFFSVWISVMSSN
jgi:hypothetical protein